MIHSRLRPFSTPVPMFLSVSVIIPCRDNERWLRSAIDSALACEGVGQVVVADDGSSDGSPAVASSFGDRITLLRLPPRGGNIARNAGLAAATGAWVQFLDADDYLEPGKISRQLAEAGDASQHDVLYSPIIEERVQETLGTHRTIPLIDTSADLFTQWITWQLPQTGGALWRREALLRIGGWKDDQPCCQEHELYLRALQAGLRFHFCPTPGAVYRIWSEQTVCRKDPVQVIRERTRLIEACLAWLDAQRLLRPIHRAEAGRVFFEMARTWARDDLDAATAYHAHWHRRGLIHATGPAAPPSYRLIRALLGFRRAEALALRLRGSGG